MIYTKKVLSHFQHPHNLGEIKDADAYGEVTNPVCGDRTKIYLKIKDNKIIDVKFEALGCAAAVATSSALTDMVKGKSLEEALAVTKEEIVEELGGMPVEKVHCSMLGIDALRQAVDKYKNKK